ncbi:SagB/ThcOx family dehydrogenase [Marinobacter halodurans]|uniref:SagB/ThcOx family dehydrogenase n=1 Tax=Marinobacter halodurans TaxID=2528979 RepID=A0ABY1ZS87_9GAMM|nr:SagB/ThcOx family dehydrogenase [Marinobacter halodurans]TBW58860.1 SagB/ThcOx family dehydrogenase [Marinobacter halodurans]
METANLAQSAIGLPHPPHNSQVPLETALASRSSCRRFARRLIPLESLSQLLWAGQGYDPETHRRTAPSAKQAYPLQLQVVTGEVGELVPDVYRYDPLHHQLHATGIGDVRATLQSLATEDQPWLAQAPLVLAISANLSMMTHLFGEQPPQGERGIRYAYIETGAVAENLQLQATALELGSVIVGAFNDRGVGQALDLEAGFAPTALVCVGHPAH